MAKEKAQAPPLSQLPTRDPETGCLLAVIETPKGSHNKYDYDAEYRGLVLAAVLPEGEFFPYDFGFIPATLGADGDPLDVLVLLDAPVIPGCIVPARLIGAIEAKQREKGSRKWIRNDRLIAVAMHAHTHAHIRSIDDLRPHMLDEISAFFENYNRLKGNSFRPLAQAGPKRAQKLVAAGVALFRGKKKHARKERAAA